MRRDRYQRDEVHVYVCISCLCGFVFVHWSETFREGWHWLLTCVVCVAECVYGHNLNQDIRSWK